MFETCRTWRTRLTLYAEGSLSPNQQSRLFLHLAHCAECQQALEADEALHDFFQRNRDLPRRGGTAEFELHVLQGLQTPLPLLSRLLNRLRCGAQYVQQLVSGAVVAAALTGFCFFVTLHAPPQKTKSHLSETPLLPQSAHTEPPLPLSTLLQTPTPRAALLWMPPAHKAAETRKSEQPRKQKRKTPFTSGAKEDSNHIVS